MKTYNIRHLDEKFWKQVKARADQEGRPLAWIIPRLLEYYRDHGLPIAPTEKREEELVTK